MPHKPWKEKLNTANGLPKVVKLKGKAAKKWGNVRMAIPSPIEVEALMRKVPKGKIATINEHRNTIAKKHKSDIGCPITTGIFAWISSHAAAEDEAAGKKRITPYWRTVKNGGELNEKYPGGIANQSKRLKAEGHKIIAKGKRTFVEDYEKKLMRM